MVKVLLIVVQGKPEGKTIPVAGPVFRIGRAVDCHLRPNSEEVSRVHAEITLSESEAVVRDMGSRNGTRVNGKLLTGPHRLKSGELLQVGPLTFAVAVQGVPAMAEAVAAGSPLAAGAGAPGRGGMSLDEVPPDQVDAWLVSDQSKPTPDRPSSVYDGDTLTLEAYKERKETSKPPSTASMPTLPQGPAPKASAPPERDEDAPSDLEAMLGDIEQLPEGAGDEPVPIGDEAESDADEAGLESEAEASLEDEFIDESNPFYAAKKAAKGESVEDKKQVFKDSSEAASDILRKMLERRRAPR